MFGPLASRKYSVVLRWPMPSSSAILVPTSSNRAELSQVAETEQGFTLWPEWVFAGETRRRRSRSAEISADAEISASGAAGDSELFHSGLERTPIHSGSAPEPRCGEGVLVLAGTLGMISGRSLALRPRRAKQAPPWAWLRVRTPHGSGSDRAADGEPARRVSLHEIHRIEARGLPSVCAASLDAPRCAGYSG